MKASTISERSWENANRRRDMRDAVRELTDTYDQSEVGVDYSIGYSRESLEYTREWVENNDNAPQRNVSTNISISTYNICWFSC